MVAGCDDGSLAVLDTPIGHAKRRAATEAKKQELAAEAAKAALKEQQKGGKRVLEILESDSTFALGD